MGQAPVMGSSHELTLLSRPGSGAMGALYLTITELVGQLNSEERAALALECVSRP